MLRKMLVTVVVAATLGTPWSASADEPYFIGLGQLPGGYGSRAISVSDDGAVVVGQAGNADGNTEAFCWSSETGMVGLGYLPSAGDQFTSSANDVSADGAVIVGTSTSAAAQGAWEAFRWTQETGMVGLGFVPGWDRMSQGTGVSADGSVVTGCSHRGGSVSVAFRWTEADGMESIGDLPGGGTRGVGLDISANGSVIVGQGSSDMTPQEAFRWTAPNGNEMEGLGALIEGGFSRAYNVSDDGAVVVGWSSSAHGGDEAFRWTEDDGMIGLGDLLGGDFESWAFDSSGDGSVIVGWGYTADGQEAFIWTESVGMRSLGSVLTHDVGLDLDGWILEYAREISADGKFVVGSGDNPEGEGEAWLVYLGDPIPCKGDLNEDGLRDAEDLLTLLASYGSGAGGDIDGDGDTDLADLAWLLTVYEVPCL